MAYLLSLLQVGGSSWLSCRAPRTGASACGRICDPRESVAIRIGVARTLHARSDFPADQRCARRTHPHADGNADAGERDVHSHVPLPAPYSNAPDPSHSLSRTHHATLHSTHCATPLRAS